MEIRHKPVQVPWRIHTPTEDPQQVTPPPLEPQGIAPPRDRHAVRLIPTKRTLLNLIVLDRDGVINQDREGYVRSADEWVPIPHSLEAIALLNRYGWQVAVATNQGGIGKGLYSEATLAQIHDKLLRMVQAVGGQIAHIAYCPHTDAQNCVCRKPKPGMLQSIAARFGLPPTKIPMVGDNLRDLQAAQALGSPAFLVRTGHGKETEAAGNLPPNTVVYDTLWELAQDWAALADAAEADRKRKRKNDDDDG